MAVYALKCEIPIYPLYYSLRNRPLSSCGSLAVSPHLTAHSHHTCSFLGYQYPGFRTVCLILLFQHLCIKKKCMVYLIHA